MPWRHCEHVQDGTHQIKFLINENCWRNFKLSSQVTLNLQYHKFHQKLDIITTKVKEEDYHLVVMGLMPNLTENNLDSLARLHFDGQTLKALELRIKVFLPR
jgi:hypothetical protein